MPDRSTDPPSTGPIDTELLDRIATHLARSTRFETVHARPTYAPNAVVAEYDLGYFPGGVTSATLRIRWFKTEDFSIHYAEHYQTEDSWECRWDRHPNTHNTREHFHPPPNAATPGEDDDHPTEYRNVLEMVLAQLDDRIEAFWNDP